MMEKTDQHTDTDTTDNNLSTVREEDALLHRTELGCDVSVGRKSTERQEWSFTLYDLDGQGRVTKDEVAQLLKSLYDSVGSSISLPQAGTKSLKLLLTVSPDQTRTDQDKPDDQQEVKPDLNCKECNSDKDKMHCQKKDINSKLNNGAFVKLTPKKSSSDDSGAAISLQNNLSKAHRESHAHSSMKRMSVIEQRQLAELVKFNMDKNKEKKSKHHSGKHKQTLHLSHVLENPDRRSYYLDLAGIDNPSSFTLPTSPANNTELCTRSPQKLRTKSKSAAQRRQIDRTIAQDHVFREHFTDGNHAPHKTHDESLPTTHATPKTTPIQGAAASPYRTTGKTKPGLLSHHKRGAMSPNKHCCSRNSPKKERIFSTPMEHTEVEMQQKVREKTAEQCVNSAEKATDPHKHRRHKQHREKNHVRAMMQVAQWIEKEHAPTDDAFGSVSVERHEHQHFHEHHHHHHYHHYYQT